MTTYAKVIQIAEKYDAKNGRTTPPTYATNSDGEFLFVKEGTILTPVSVGGIVKNSKGEQMTKWALEQNIKNGNFEKAQEIAGRS